MEKMRLLQPPSLWRPEKMRKCTSMGRPELYHKTWSRKQASAQRVHIHNRKRVSFQRLQPRYRKRVSL